MGEVRGDFLVGPSHGTTPAAVKANKILNLDPLEAVEMFIVYLLHAYATYLKVQVGKSQEKAQSEKDSHSKNRGGKKTN